MDQGLLPRRYAKALYKFAAEHGDQTVVYGLMQNVAAAFANVPALLRTISNPYVAEPQKEKLLLEAAGSPAPDKGGDILSDFVRLLVKNHRIDLTRDIALAYQELYRAENNICRVNVTSATPLSDADRTRLEQLVTRRLDGAKAEMSFSVDPEIIGGFVVTVDNDRLDASVRNELSRLRRQLFS